MFKKRETLIQNMAYMALMAGINVIFVLLSALFPPLMFLMIFLLTLANAVVTIFCKKKYYPIYFIVTVGLCLLTTFGIYIYDTFFYVIPSLITGFVFGLLIEKRWPAIHILTITNIIQYSLMLLTFLILDKVLVGVKFTDTLLAIFGLQNFAFKEVFIHVFAFLIASIQNLFTYFIIKMEVKKLGITVNLNDDRPLYKYIAIFVSITLAIITYFYYAPLCFAFIFIALFYGLYEIGEILINKKLVPIIILGATLIISIFLFAFLYQYTTRPLSIVLLSIPLGLINIVSIVNNTLLKRANSLK